MQEFSTIDIVLALLVCLLIIALLMLAAVNRKLRLRLADHLTEAHKNMASAENSLRALQLQYDSNMEFQKNLSEAELTTRLQRSRLTTQHAKDLTSTPERYQYVRSLAATGMGAEEIAAILSISSQEAEQLVKLSQLGKSA
jgi:hypothetical protein